MLIAALLLTPSEVDARCLFLFFGCTRGHYHHRHYHHHAHHHISVVVKNKTVIVHETKPLVLEPVK